MPILYCGLILGFERGRRVYLELLALDYPDHHFCQVFDGMKSNDTSKEYNRIPQQLPGELCTIDNEVALLKDLRNCTSSEQASTSLLTHKQNLISPTTLICSK